MAMLSELDKLAGRKVTEARARAKVSIDRWEGMTTLIKQVSQQAAVTIDSPDTPAAKISQARNELSSADYLRALKLDKQAVNARSSARALALQSFKSAESKRAAALSTASENVVSELTRHEKHLNSLKEEKSQALKEASLLRHMPFSDPNLVTARYSSGCGCIGGIIFFLYIITVTPSDRNGIQHVSPLVDHAFLIFGVFGWVSVPGIILLIQIGLWMLKKVNADSKAAQIESNAEARWRELNAKITEINSREMASLQAVLVTSKANLQKIVEAIKVLEHG